MTPWKCAMCSCANMAPSSWGSVATSASEGAVFPFCSWIGFLIHLFSIHGTQEGANLNRMLNMSTLTFHSAPPSAVPTACHGIFSALNDAFNAINISLFLKRKGAQVHVSLLKFPVLACHLSCKDRRQIQVVVNRRYGAVTPAEGCHTARAQTRANFAVIKLFETRKEKKKEYEFQQTKRGLKSTKRL